MPVRPSTQKLVNWGGGQRRCACCGVSICDEAVLPSMDEGGGVYGPTAPDTPREVEIEAPGEEARVRKDLPRPYAPTQAEIDKHRVDHLPYRNWCPECVEGFARERAHEAHEGHERQVPLVSCDYLYITCSGVFARDELPEGERSAACRVLVIKCAMTKCIFAHAVPQKGVDPDGFVIDRLREDIVWLGHASVVVRRDNEPALARVVEKSIQVLKPKASPRAGKGPCRTALRRTVTLRAPSVW